MYEILVNPITLLCLGIIFIFTSLLFFYFKRTFSLLEKAQMDQARVLQGFITNMEMSQQLAAQRMNQMGGAPPTQHSPVNESSEQVNDGLIDVSDDDDDSDSEYESDSDDETENNDDVSVGSKLDIEPQVIELNQASDVKIIQLEGNNDLENSTIEIASLEELEDMNDIDDDDDTSDDDSNDDDDNEEANVNEKVLLESSGVEKEVKKLEKIDYKSLNVQALRDYCISCGVIQGGDKKNKKEMIKLLDDMEK